ncbi:hypothetical protein NDU88_004479 [Pleurodeles waltl]|uniref:Uncharacterized protein n=1 Tax=Pleurodeles waltl TaxID=8319 RepID=A0AAV7UFT5_PLEWA|nr:hypothetical protein NDU88_004479 [Pleurodeles waltl]
MESHRVSGFQRRSRGDIRRVEPYIGEPEDQDLKAKQSVEDVEGEISRGGVPTEAVAGELEGDTVPRPSSLTKRGAEVPMTAAQSEGRSSKQVHICLIKEW